MRNRGYWLGWCVACAWLSGCGDDGVTSTGTTEAMTTMGTTSATTSMTTTTGVSSSTDPTVTSTDPTTGDPSTTSGSTGSQGSSTGGSTVDGTTDPLPACGDGNVDAGEDCDLGAGNADDGACTTACKNAACGDGLVQAGVEECDDGNADDADACVAGCKNAVCGDTFVQMGVEGCDDGNTDPNDGCAADCTVESCGNAKVEGTEECDDGNADDTDVCTSLCKNAACGDTFVQAGAEECDDGNMVDTDMCVAGCKNAKCGDGFVQAGVEMCDDGNMSDADMCTSACKPPSCTDMLKDGAETDVDCGGTCPKCANGKACLINADCASNYCNAMKCEAFPQSCKAILANNPQAKTGKFTIDIDANGPLAQFDVYCDMTTNGGGWTIFYGKSNADNEVPMISDTEQVANDPTTFKAYNLNRAKKIALSAISTETILVRKTGPWLKANSAAFDATLAVANSTFKKAVLLTASNNMTGMGFLGWANFNFAGGGDFGISRNPDGVTGCNTTTMQGFDHHSAAYWMLNCGCDRQYFYSYSSGTQDGDAHYEANTALGAWTVTAGCAAGEGGGIELYAAMR